MGRPPWGGQDKMDVNIAQDMLGKDEGDMLDSEGDLESGKF